MTAPPIVLRSPRRPIVVGLGAVVALVGLAVAGMVAASGLAVVPVVLCGLAAAIAWVTVRDTPFETTLDASGVTRRCLARRQHVAWDQISTIGRGVAPVVRDHKESGIRNRARGTGALFIEVGRRRLDLSSAAEEPSEFDRIAAHVPGWAPDVVIRARAPVPRA